MLNIALYQPDIPQNTAAIIRLCSCFDVTLNIIEPCGFRIDDKSIKRVAMDYVKDCRIVIHKSFKNFLNEKKNYNLVLMTTKSKKIYYDFNFGPKDIIIFGRESSGVPKEVHKLSNESLKIPIKKGKRSLNIVTAVAITIAEALKQNNKFK